MLRTCPRELRSWSSANDTIQVAVEAYKAGQKSEPLGYLDR